MHIIPLHIFMFKTKQINKKLIDQGTLPHGSRTVPHKGTPESS